MIATHDRNVDTERLRDRSRVRDHLPEADRAVHASDREVLEGSVRDRVTGRSVGPLPHDDGSGRSSGLEPACEVDRVACHEALVRCAMGGQDLAGVDGDPERQRLTALIASSGPKLRHAGLHGQRRPDGPLGIVVVRGGVAEDGHDCVADELLDRAAVPLDLVGHRPEERLQDAAQLLRVEPGRQLCRGHKVGEHDCHDLALLERLGRRGRCRSRWRCHGRRIKRRSAGAAEPGRLRGRRAAARAIPPEGRPAGTAEPVARRVRRSAAQARPVRSRSLLDCVAHVTSCG